MKHPLTSTQQTFYTENVTSDLPVWNQVLYVMFDGKKSVEEFTAVLNEIIAENEVLRTSFIKDDNGQIFQYINAHIEEKFECLNFKDVNELENYLKIQVNSPTSLFVNPLKFYILTLPGKFGFALKIHHMLCDGFCVSLLIDKVKNKLSSDRQEAKIYSYQKYLNDENSYKESKRFQKSISFWNHRLSRDFNEKLFDIAHSNFDYSASEYRFSFSGESVKKAKQLCQTQEIPFSAFVYAVFSIYAYKFLGQRDFAIGMPIINRVKEEDLHTLGLYMHILPLIMHIKNDSAFLSVLEDSYGNIIELLKNQKFTQYDIKENCTFNKHKAMFFDVAVDYQPDYYLSDCEYKIIYSNSISSALEIHFYEMKNDGLSVNIRYRNSVFTEKNIIEMCDHWVDIIDVFAENPYALLDDTEIYKKCKLSPEEKQKLSDFNNTCVPYNKKQSIYELFAEQVRREPDKTAVIADGKSITIGELLNISRILDKEIRTVTKDNKSVIAVIADRSVEMYSAIYGIIRGGNAYLPVDPNYPKDRIEYMLNNSDAALVIAQGKYVSLAGNTPCIDMTSFIEHLPESEEFPVCIAEENDTAYVIYTSGSTGNPKGAKISHKSAINRIAWMHDLYPLGEHDVILQKTPYTFDVSVWEIFWWGMFGGKLVASRPGEHFLPAKILDEALNHEVTHLHFVPSVFDLFLTYLEENKDEIYKFDSVKHVFLSGEALNASLIKRFYALYTYEKVKLHNLYGPTECAVDVTYYDCTPADADPVPIGKPIYNTQMYVLDKHMNILPIGITGELYIGGLNVGQGYLNNPSLTAEKFIENPFGEGKLYKTGDLAYWREDGNIVYVGRNDFQVKIRGLRIELGEIENAISSVDGIRQSVVVVRKDESDRQIICAFYTGEEKSAKHIRNEIAKSLPQYMIPNTFMHLDKIPLTTSGKINRNDLPEVDLKNIESTVDYVAPETEKEIALAEAAKEVLNLENPGMMDNFYDLGGDSIRAIHLVSELRNNGYELSAADIMQSQTFRDIAEFMKPVFDRDIYEQDEISGLIPFTPIMRAYNNAEPTEPERFVHSCIIRTDCDEQIAQKAFDALVSHHDILRAVVGEEGLVIYPSSEHKAYSFAVQTIADPQEAEEHLNHTDIKIDLHGEYLTDVIFCKTEGMSLIRISVHHFLIDLISWEILLSDFKTAVTQLKNNEPVTLPAKTASFKQWAELLSAYGEKHISDDERAYWKNIDRELEGVTSILSLQKEQNGSEACSFTLGREITKNLCNEANNSYRVHANEILLTALGLAAGKLTGRTVGIYVESHDRSELHKPISVERTVGWFTSCYPVIIDPDKPEADTLIGIKETLRRNPKNGTDYLLLSKQLHKNADIIFNYYKENSVNNSAKNQPKAINNDGSVFPGKINVNCYITGDILLVSIYLPAGGHPSGIAKKLGIEFKEQIKTLIDICTAADTVIQTRSDFSDKELTESELEDLLDLFDWTENDE